MAFAIFRQHIFCEKNFAQYLWTADTLSYSQKIDLMMWYVDHNLFNQYHTSFIIYYVFIFFSSDAGGSVDCRRTVSQTNAKCLIEKHEPTILEWIFYVSYTVLSTWYGETVVVCVCSNVNHMKNNVRLCSLCRYMLT